MFYIKSPWIQALVFGTGLTLINGVLDPMVNMNNTILWTEVFRQAVIWFSAGALIAFLNFKFFSNRNKAN